MWSISDILARFHMWGVKIPQPYITMRDYARIVNIRIESDYIFYDFPNRLHYSRYPLGEFNDILTRACEHIYEYAVEIEYDFDVQYCAHLLATALWAANRERVLYIAHHCCNDIFLLIARLLIH